MKYLKNKLEKNFHLMDPQVVVYHTTQIVMQFKPQMLMEIQTSFIGNNFSFLDLEESC